MRKAVAILAILIGGCTSLPTPSPSSSSLMPTLEPSTPAASPALGCPATAPLTAPDVLGLAPAERLACFGGATIAFSGWLFRGLSLPAFGGDGVPPWSTDQGRFCILSEPHQACPSSVAHLDAWRDPTLITLLVAPGESAAFMLTGHFDDARIADCGVTFRGSNLAPDPTTWCREQFVLTGLAPLP
jgi:hypothetical protein